MVRSEVALFSVVDLLTQSAELSCKISEQVIPSLGGSGFCAGAAGGIAQTKVTSTKKERMKEE
jgi:hypothetical protein